MICLHQRCRSQRQSKKRRKRRRRGEEKREQQLLLSNFDSEAMVFQGHLITVPLEQAVRCTTAERNDVLRRSASVTTTSWRWVDGRIIRSWSDKLVERFELVKLEDKSPWICVECAWTIANNCNERTTTFILSFTRLSYFFPIIENITNSIVGIENGAIVQA